MPRRPWVWLVAICLMIGTLSLAGPGQSAQPGVSSVESVGATRPARPRIRPSHVIPGERVRVIGRLTPRVRRPVRLQRRAGGRWRTIAKTRSGRTGRYRFAVPTRWAPARLRIRTPAAAGLPAANSRPRLLGVLDQRVLLVAPAGVQRGAAVTVTVQAAPARRGRPVVLERATAGAWSEVARGRQDREGYTGLSLPTEAVGGFEYRARTLPWRGAPAAVSGPNTVTVSAPGTPAPTPAPTPTPTPTDTRPIPLTMTAPAADSTLTGNAQVRVRIDEPAANVTTVRIYATGRLLGNAVRQSDGTWLLTIDTTGLENGLTDLTARAAGDARRGLSAATAVRIANTADPSTISGLPSGFRIDSLVSGLYYPTSFAALPDGRVLITEHWGRVWVADPETGAKSVVLDLRDIVRWSWDKGLVGLTVDPDFATNHRFYLAYTLKGSSQCPTSAQPLGDTTINVGDNNCNENQHSDPVPTWAQQVTRFTFSGTPAQVRSSAHVVLGRVTGQACWDDWTLDDCLPIKGGTHSVDDLVFDQAGNLLVSVGDGVFWGAGRPQANRSQDLGVLMGKILRIDPDTGAGAPGNPFVGSPNPNTRRVYAYGFRNPFRMALSPTGELYVGDVGENTWEELDLVVPGGNYGWPCLEGTVPWADRPSGQMCDDIVSGVTPTEEPVVNYLHAPGGAAVGGVFYTGTGHTGTPYPAQYADRLFWGDYAMGLLRTLDPTAPALGTPFAGRPAAGAPVKFGIGPDGNVWYLSITSSDLRRIVYDPTSTGCPSSRYLVEYWPSADGTGTPLRVCRDTLPADLGAPPDLDTSNGYRVKVTGSPQLRPGTYTVTKDPDVALSVNGATVTGQFRVDSPNGQDVATSIEAVLSYPSPIPTDGAEYRLSWTRTGAPPVVSLGGIEQGTRVASGTVLPWTVTAATATGQPLSSDDVRVEMTLLHYTITSSAEDMHTHPGVSSTGTSGSFLFDEEHAPGMSALMVTAIATDPATGATRRSAPVYVCLNGNEVGVCG